MPPIDGLVGPQQRLKRVDFLGDLHAAMVLMSAMRWTANSGDGIHIGMALWIGGGGG